MTPYEIVRERYQLPFNLRPYQADEVNKMCALDRCGFYWEPGVGKTAGSTVYALYWSLMGGFQNWVCPMPPILLTQWGSWLNSIIDKKTGKRLEPTIYRGTAKARQRLSLDGQFTLMSYDILKNDFDRLYDAFGGRRVGGLCDEATAVKNIKSQNHKAVDLLFEGRPLALLTGTPVNKPIDGYAYIKLVAPGTYRNKRQFEKLHVASKDGHDNPREWKNLDLLAANMRVNTSRILVREVRQDLPPVIYTPIKYELAPAHLELYRRIAAERLVEFEGRGVIDAVSSGALRSALQQIVVNWGEFAMDSTLRPTVLDLAEEVLSEIGDRKLVVVAHFIRSNRYLLQQLQKYGAVAVYGEVSPQNKQKAIDRFKLDRSCRVILVQPSSAGYGVDGLQHVCSDMLIVEAPTTPTPFEQVVKRLDRDGQLDVVRIRVAMAQGTVQVGMFRSLLENDALANQVQGGYRDLKESIYGE